MFKSFKKIFSSKENEPAEDLSHLTEEQKTSLFEKYAFNKFDKKYFKLLARKSDPSGGEFAPDLEYEFRHNAFVRKFAVICLYKQDTANGNVELNKGMLDNFRSYGTKNNIELYIVLGLGGSPAKPQHVFTIPLVHFKTNPVSFDSIEVFKKDPGADFFYQRDIDCLT